jgi:hypothetical protein
VNIEKEWRRDPPLTKMDNLDALWLDFVRRRADPASPVRRFRDDIPNWCREAPGPRVALWRAVRSKRPSGKMHNHQSKVTPALPAFGLSLSRRLKALMKSEDFHQLYVLMGLLAPKGIGPMTIYDVATRFGAYLGLKPEYIYIHAGTKAGLQALGIATKGHPFISMDMLPVELQDKDPDTVEDFLCTYRSAFLKL